MDETKKFEQLSKETGLPVEWLREQRKYYTDYVYDFTFEEFAEGVKFAKRLADLSLPEDGDEEVDVAKEIFEELEAEKDELKD